MILIDSNIVSALMAAERSRMVLEWFDARENDPIFTSSVVVMELRLGVAILPDGKRKTALQNDLQRVLASVFSGRVHPFDEGTAAIYADLAARLKRNGTPVGQSDMMIAATAMQYDATVATRNVRHFKPCGIRVANPFEET